MIQLLVAPDVPAAPDPELIPLPFPSLIPLVDLSLYILTIFFIWPGLLGFGCFSLISWICRTINPEAVFLLQLLSFFLPSTSLPSPLSCSFSTPPLWLIVLSFSLPFPFAISLSFRLCSLRSSFSSNRRRLRSDVVALDVILDMALESLPDIGEDGACDTCPKDDLSRRRIALESTVPSNPKLSNSSEQPRSSDIRARKGNVLRID
ncbi:uncharacterized protein F4812DRAFT_444867 [Daldinia caldariorum]|uniref:uncharacterized protein n=1 Tax=Daldinia caldariorum TaxID=326644 RepID=UPI00200898CA|nr:uncharacterized protein F4812DRAFT_444867 [Daldinia caldariorum]KAI1463900.1 hypothetical protein F4812DRAFT_444867 [Daldinia caldariorum]